MPKPNCPVCEDNKNVFRIDDIYFRILENDPSIKPHFKNSQVQKSQVFKKLQPPTIDKQPIWLIIAPDIIASIILFLSLFLSIFNLLNGTKNAAIISALTLVLFLTFLFYRKRINNAFQMHKFEREALVQKTTQKVDLWSGLLICLSDATIFNADHSINLTIDQFQGFLSDID